MKQFKHKNPTALVILDGFGISLKHKYNAIYQAHSIVINWFNKFPSCALEASGKYVGLLPGMIGNSEVGHLTIGAGRVIEQPVTILHNAIANGSFFQNQSLINKLKKLKQNNKTLHIMGLLSDAGVHSDIEVLFALLKLAKKQKLNKVIIHVFLDGRDVPPKSAAKYLKQLDKYINKLNIGKIGSIHGRFYAMDRDKNWDRTQKSYLILTSDIEPKFKNWQEALNYFYNKNITDEFIPPVALSKNIKLKKGDGLIFFNIREDRARQLTEALLNKSFDKFKTADIKLEFFITGVQYAPEFKLSVLCVKEKIKNTFFDILEKYKLEIFSIAETEKYAHITYFFNGGREIIRPRETRVLIPSKSFKHTYIDMPKMSAPEITQAVLSSLNTDPKDFYLINYANADMVGHSGNLQATIKAIKCLNKQLELLYKTLVEELNGVLYITSDHGNAEYMYNPKIKQVVTAHTTNKIPFIQISKNLKHYNLPLTQLADIAPFILKNLNIPVPEVMKKKIKFQNFKI